MLVIVTRIDRSIVFARWRQCSLPSTVSCMAHSAHTNLPPNGISVDSVVSFAALHFTHHKNRTLSIGQTPLKGVPSSGGI